MEKWHNTIINISFVTTSEFKKIHTISTAKWLVYTNQQLCKYSPSLASYSKVRHSLWLQIGTSYTYMANVLFHRPRQQKKTLRITEQRIWISPFKNYVVFSKNKYINRTSSHFILLKIMSDLNRATVCKEALLSAYYSVQTPSVRLCCMLLSHIKLHSRI